MKNWALLLSGIVVCWVGWKFWQMRGTVQMLDEAEPKTTSGSYRGMPMKLPWDDFPAETPVLAETLLHGAQGVEYYDLEGNTREDLEASLANHKRTTPNLGEEAHVLSYLVWHPGNPSDGLCGATDGVVDAHVQALMPRWRAGPQATDEAKRWFSFMNHLWANHEQGHIDITLAAVAPATADMRRTNCISVKGTLEQINERLSQQQKDYDTHQRSAG